MFVTVNIDPSRLAFEKRAFAKIGRVALGTVSVHYCGLIAPPAPRCASAERKCARCAFFAGYLRVIIPTIKAVGARYAGTLPLLVLVHS